MTGGASLNSFETGKHFLLRWFISLIRYLGFAKVGLGICYDIRFPEMAMIAARQGEHCIVNDIAEYLQLNVGCHALIYPGAFNLTTGPLHWELLQKARAIDNQVFVSMCSPARDLTAGYHAWGHSMVVDPMGRILAEAGEGEEIIYAQIEPDVFESTRAAIPVTVQRRFDVYPDVSRLPNLSSL